MQPGSAGEAAAGGAEAEGGSAARGAAGGDVKDEGAGAEVVVGGGLLVGRAGAAPAPVRCVGPLQEVGELGRVAGAVVGGWGEEKGLVG